ncbi:hypothetical protein CEE37_13345 [candidate division LCP-89 bacterium B3_LCP]|uniref:Uncharacterized protein n=1 Tax=candidate division LCP-89 bacterium B3_LCP TaxID=2012998 RepID=A0A532USM6_UNCL8|nr:MAG: hypothetical protein CEE37_13345 [candidate division LCP-89 bacterium B3_LCP]
MLKWFKTRFSQKPKPSRNLEVVEIDQRAQELVTLGDKMFTTEDYKGAMEAYESALQIDGHSAEAWHRRGRVLFNEEKIEEALACYVRSIELNPKNPDTWCGLGEGILAFIKADKEPLFIREHRVEIISEAQDAFAKALKLGGDLPKARVGRDSCRSMLKQDNFKLAKPPQFSFHSGGILERGKREAVSPFLKPGDYRRKNLPILSDD